MKKLLSTNAYPFLPCRLIALVVFLSEGFKKFIRPDEVGAGRFAKIGFDRSSFWAHFTGAFEMVCGLLVLIGLFSRFSVMPLLDIIVTAFITTRLTILTAKGFWPFAHEYRTDFAMTLLLRPLLIYSGGGRLKVARIHKKTGRSTRRAFRQGRSYHPDSHRPCRSGAAVHRFHYYL